MLQILEKCMGFCFRIRIRSIGLLDLLSVGLAILEFRTHALVKRRCRSLALSPYCSFAFLRCRDRPTTGLGGVIKRLLCTQPNDLEPDPKRLCDLMVQALSLKVENDWNILF